MRQAFTAAALFALGASLPAQGAFPSRIPQRPRTDETARKPIRTGNDNRPGSLDTGPARPSTFGVYRERTSRELFAACDENGDDQILLIEAKRALRGIDRKKFQLYDTNNDGRLQFNEFDEHFKSRTKFGGQIVITGPALRRLARRVTRTVADPLLLSWFAKLDKDGNDRLEFDEWKVLGDLLDKDPKAAFVKLDKDLSNTLTVRELEPMLPRISLVDRTEAKARATQPTLRPLPASYQVADLNKDSLISVSELGRALSRIHPSLARHAATIFERADADSDGHLNKFEIQAASSPLGRSSNRRR